MILIDSNQGRLFKWREEYNQFGQLVAVVLADPDWIPPAERVFDFGIIGWESTADFGRPWPLLLHCGCKWQYRDDDYELMLNTYGCKASHGVPS